MRAELERGAGTAGAAYERLAAFLRDELLPHAGDTDAFGREQYVRFSRLFVGSVVDVDEAYAWGQEELARIIAEMQRTADRILPGASVAEAMAHLDADPARKLQGTEALQKWMQAKSDEAVDALGCRALRHPGTDPPPRVPHRADPERRRLLHRPERGSRHAPRPDVVVGARRRHRVRHLA